MVGRSAGGASAAQDNTGVADRPSRLSLVSDSHADQARSFDRVAGVYQKARPSYPAAAVEWVLEAAPGLRVVDLAAGTGKLTEVLVAAGADVTAVEPLANMRAELERALPAVRALDGTAERIPLPDGERRRAYSSARRSTGSTRLLALGEIARVLVPGGVLGLVWNLRDEHVPWVADLTVALRGAGDVLAVSRESPARPFASERFTAAERREFRIRCRSTGPGCASGRRRRAGSRCSAGRAREGARRDRAAGGRASRAGRPRRRSTCHLSRWPCGRCGARPRPASCRRRPDRPTARGARRRGRSGARSRPAPGSRRARAPWRRARRASCATRSCWRC